MKKQLTVLAMVLALNLKATEPYKINLHLTTTSITSKGNNSVGAGLIAGGAFIGIGLTNVILNGAGNSSTLWTNYIGVPPSQTNKNNYIFEQTIPIVAGVLISGISICFAF